MQTFKFFGSQIHQYSSKCLLVWGSYFERPSSHWDSKHSLIFSSNSLSLSLSFTLEQSHVLCEYDEETNFIWFNEESIYSLAVWNATFSPYLGAYACICYSVSLPVRQSIPLLIACCLNYCKIIIHFNMEKVKKN